MTGEKNIHQFRRWFVSLMTLGILGLLIWVMIAPRPVVVERTTVHRGHFENILKSDGYLRSKDRHLITAFADGRLDRVTLKIGDHVKKGQVLTKLEWDYKKPVVAPIDGVVAKVYRESAGPIVRAQPILEIIDPTQLEVVAELLTADAAKVKEGNVMRLSGWGGSNVLEARVTRVSQAGFKKVSALGVEEERTEVVGDLIAVPDDVAKHLGDQFHSDLALVMDVLDQVLIVPVGALFRDGQDWSVYRVKEGRAEKVKVTLQQRSAIEAVITNGVREGDEVILYPGDLVKDGARVK